MQIEDVAGIGLASRRLMRQQRELAMRRGVLAQIVDDDERVAAAVAEIFGHGEAGEGRDPLQARRRRGGGDDEDGALEGAVGAHGFNGALYGRGALPDGDIDAE